MGRINRIRHRQHILSSQATHNGHLHRPVDHVEARTWWPMAVRHVGSCISAALSLTSCGVLGLTGDCTTIGCTSGLTVHLPVLPAGAYTIEIFLAGISGGGPALAYTCAGGPQCTQDVFFSDIVINHATVRVATAVGSRITEIPTVTYETSRPNGPHCAPECRNATITAQLPA
jgi:hypothetical protein